MKLPATYRKLLSHEQLAALACSPDTTPVWLLDLCLLAYHSGLSIADIANIKWKELIVTTESARQIIKLIRNADDIESIRIYQLNEDAKLLFRDMLKTGHAGPETNYFFTSTSRSDISTYQKTLHNLIVILRS